MDQPLHPLSVADEAPGAAIVYLPLFPHGFRTAIGAFAVKGPYLTRIIAREVIQDLRNDIACPLHDNAVALPQAHPRSEHHTYEPQSLMRNSHTVSCLKKQNYNISLFSDNT